MPEEVVADVFGLAVGQVADGTSPESVEEWDSVGHMNLVLQLESTYEISLSPDDALAITDVASLKRILDNHSVTW